MELTGKIVNILPLITGNGKNGPWKKQEFILETNTQPQRRVCFSLWGDKVDQFKLNIGDEFEVSFDLESREYNGRWYTDVKAWKIAKGNTINNPGTQEWSVKELEENDPFPLSDPGPDDLPF